MYGLTVCCVLFKKHKCRSPCVESTALRLTPPTSAFGYASSSSKALSTIHKTLSARVHTHGHTHGSISTPYATPAKSLRVETHAYLFLAPKGTKIGTPYSAGLHPRYGHTL